MYAASREQEEENERIDDENKRLEQLQSDFRVDNSVFKDDDLMASLKKRMGDGGGPDGSDGGGGGEGGGGPPPPEPPSSPPPPTVGGGGGAAVLEPPARASAGGGAEIGPEIHPRLTRGKRASRRRRRRRRSRRPWGATRRWRGSSACSTSVTASEERSAGGAAGEATAGGAAGRARRFHQRGAAAPASGALCGEKVEGGVRGGEGATGRLPRPPLRHGPWRLARSSGGRAVVWQCGMHRPDQAPRR